MSGQVTVLVIHRGSLLCRQLHYSVGDAVNFLRSQHYVPTGGVNEWSRGDYLAVIQDGRDCGDPTRREWRRYGATYTPWCSDYM